MKKLAKLTALLLTGVMLLLLASCGAAPNPGVPGGSSGLTAAEAKAKQQIFNALNEYRTSKGVKKVEEISELSAAEQFRVDAFRKAGDYKLPESEYNPIIQEYYKLIPAGRKAYSGLGWKYDSANYMLLEDTDPSNTEALNKLFAGWSYSESDRCTAVGIGVTTINGKIYWACAIY